MNERSQPAIRTKIVAHGPGRLQLHEIWLQENGKDSVALVWYYRDRDKFNQIFELHPTKEGQILGLYRFSTYDPYMETLRKLTEIPSPKDFVPGKGSRLTIEALQRDRDWNK